MKFKFDKNHPGTLGYYSCEGCGNVFISSVKPFHKPSCPYPKEGWNVAVYNFGPNELEEVESKGKSSTNPLLHIGLLEEILV